MYLLALISVLLLAAVSTGAGAVAAAARRDLRALGEAHATLERRVAALAPAQLDALDAAVTARLAALEAPGDGLPAVAAPAAPRVTAVPELDPDQIDALQAPLASVIYCRLRNLAAVRFADGRGWLCYAEPLAIGSPWEWRVFPKRLTGPACVIARDLTAEEARRVAEMNTPDALAWCARRRDARAGAPEVDVEATLARYGVGPWECHRGTETSWHNRRTPAGAGVKGEAVVWLFSRTQWEAEVKVGDDGENEKRRGYVDGVDEAKRRASAALAALLLKYAP